MPMAWFSVLPITSAVRCLAFPIPLVKGLKVPVSTGAAACIFAVERGASMPSIDSVGSGTFLLRNVFN